MIFFQYFTRCFWPRHANRFVSFNTWLTPRINCTFRQLELNKPFNCARLTLQKLFSESVDTLVFVYLICFFFNDTYTICLLIINFVIDILLVCGSDFGLSKESEYDQKTYSFCGTVEYMAPEVSHIFVGI